MFVLSYCCIIGKKNRNRNRASVRSSLQSLHEAERVRRREISAHSPGVGADATSEWGENSRQSPSVSVDATSEWEAPFLSAQRGAGVEKPQKHSSSRGTEETENWEAERRQIRRQTVNTKLGA